MTPRQLWEAIGEVEDDLVLEAVRPPRGGRIRAVLRLAAPLAAGVCVAAGALLAWRGALPGPALAGEGVDATRSFAASQEADTDAVPPGKEAADTAAADAGAVEDAAPAPEAAAEATQGAGGDALAALLTDGGADGVRLLAATEEEFYFADPLDGDVPAALPVYRRAGLVPDGQEEALRAALAQVLDGLGLDTALAGDALPGEDEGDGAPLVLEGLPELEAAGVARIAADRSLQVSVLFTDGGAAPAAPEEAAQLAADIQAGEPRLLAALEVDTPALTGGGRRADGGEAEPILAYYAAGQEGEAHPAAVEGLLNASYRQVRVFANADGTLRALQWDAAGPGTLLGEQDVLPREEALALLADGQYLGGSGQTEGAQAAAAVRHSRLVYSVPGAACHAPLWEFLVETGPGDDPALKEYALYYVPAVDPDALTALFAAP